MWSHAANGPPSTLPSCVPSHRPRPERLPMTDRPRPARMTASVGTIDTVDAGTRQLSGMVLPFGEVGMTSIGPVVVAPDAVITWPPDLSVVKLVDEHREPPLPIGYTTATRRTPHGWRASFHVAETTAGNEA